MVQPVEAEALLEAVANGDRPAFRQLYSLAAPRLFAVCLRMLKARDAAEDCLQDAFFRIWQKAHLFDRAKGAAMAWMTTVTRRCCLDRLSERKLVSASIEELNENFLRIEGHGDSDAMTVQQCLKRLDDKASRPILLAFHYGLSYEEIAAREGVPVGTIKSRISRGLAQLKELMG